MNTQTDTFKIYLLEEFKACIGGNWKTIGKDVQYRIDRIGPNQAILSFQGTVSIQDLAIDLKVFCNPFKEKAKDKYGNVLHRGFQEGFESAFEIIHKELIDMGIQYVDVRGYSLGAAYGMLFTLYLPKVGIETEALLYGTPRVFFFPNKKLKEEAKKRILRIENADDIICHLPPLLFGFRHVGHVYKINISNWCYTIEDHLIKNYINELSY
jgi:hypothetical protein